MTTVPNHPFRLARRARVLTQAQVAERVAEVVEHTTGRRCGIDADYVSKVERGEIHWPGEDYRAAFRAVLGAASDTALGFFCPRSADPASVTESAIVEEEDEPACAEDLMIDEKLLRYAGAATVGALSAKVPALLRGALRRVAVPARIEERHVDQLTGVIDFFERSDWLFGGGVCRSAAAGQLDWACAVLTRSSMPEPVRRAWQSATARLAGRAGFMCFDCGDQLGARRFFVVSLQLAAQANDVQQRTYTLHDAARQAVWLDRNDLGLDLIRLARADERHLSPVARAVLTTVEGAALGRQAEIAGAERAVGQADELFAHRGTETDDPAWAFYSSETQMTCEGGRALFEGAMRREDAHLATVAEHRLQTSYDRSPADRARSRAFDLIRVACLVLRFGDPDRGLDLAGQALSEAAVLRSRRIADDVAMLTKTAARLERDPAFRPRVRELRRTARRISLAVA